MKLAIAFAAALAVVALPLAADAAPKHRKHYRAGQAAYAQQQIACSPYGCKPVHRGCYRDSGRTLSGMPTGFDVEVCPGVGTLYGNR